MRGLSDTWIIIRIGHREYAVNSVFVKAMTELKHEWFISESYGTFVRGIYNIFNADIPVLDGYKVACETHQNDTKLDFSKKITSIKLTYMSWLDNLEWLAMSTDSDGRWASNEIQRNIENWLNTESFNYDEYLNKLFNRIKKYTLMNISRGNKLIEDRMGKTMGVMEAAKEIEAIRTEANRYILDALDNLIDAYTSKMSEMCIVVKASGRNFGLCIDSVELVVDVSNRATSIRKTNLSAGTIDIKGKTYNILDLTKLSKVIP